MSLDLLQHGGIIAEVKAQCDCIRQCQQEQCKQLGRTSVVVVVAAQAAAAAAAAVAMAVGAGNACSDDRFGGDSINQTNLAFVMIDGSDKY